MQRIVLTWLVLMCATGCAKLSFVDDGGLDTEGGDPSDTDVDTDTDTDTDSDTDADTGPDTDTTDLLSCLQTRTFCDDATYDGTDTICDCFSGANACSDYCQVCEGNPAHPECFDTEVDTGQDNSGTGDWCGEEIELLLGQEKQILGGSFSFMYGEFLSWSGASCEPSTGSDFYAVLHMKAGNVFVYKENLTSFNEVVRILDGCSPTANCHYGASNPAAPVRWTAPADGTYFFVLQQSSIIPDVYDFTLQHLPGSETLCFNTVDDDQDGKTDCADPDCATACNATVFLDESFDDEIPVDWVIDDHLSGPIQWAWSDVPADQPRSSTSGAGFAHIVDGASLDLGDEWLSTPELTVDRTYTKVVVSFSSRYDPGAGSASREVRVSLGSNDANVALTAQQMEGVYTFDLTDHVNSVSTFSVYWRYWDQVGLGVDSGDWAIDDVSVIGY